MQRSQYNGLILLASNRARHVNFLIHVFAGAAEIGSSFSHHLQRVNISAMTSFV